MARLREQTGRGFHEWVELVRKTGLPTRKEQTAWLMGQHGLGRTAAQFVTAEAAGIGVDYANGDALLEAMYAGPKTHLRQIHDEIVRVAKSLGTDVTVYSCQGQVTLKRNRQIAWIKPSTRTRIDLGLALGHAEAEDRLLPVTGSNEKDRVRLRVAIESLAEVDAEVTQWLKQAYDLDA